MVKEICISIPNAIKEECKKAKVEVKKDKMIDECRYVKIKKSSMHKIPTPMMDRLNQAFWVWIIWMICKVTLMNAFMINSNF